MTIHQIGGKPDLPFQNNTLSPLVNSKKQASSSFEDYLTNLQGATLPKEGLNIKTFEQLRASYADEIFKILCNQPGSQGRLYKTIDEVHMEFMEDFQKMSDWLWPLLAQSGSHMENRIAMRLDGKGSVIAEAGGQETNGSRQVEKLFNDNKEMVSQFAIMAARGAISHAGLYVEGFTEDYALDPPGAIRKHIKELENLLFGFTLTADSSGMGYEFREPL